MQPLDPDKKPAVHTTPLNHVGLWVDDLPKAVEWMTANGVRFAPGGIRRKEDFDQRIRGRSQDLEGAAMDRQNTINTNLGFAQQQQGIGRPAAPPTRTGAALDILEGIGKTLSSGGKKPLTPLQQTELLRVMRQLSDAGLTLLVSSHDWGRDLDAYDRVLVLDRQLLADGTPQQVRQALGDLRVGNHCCG
jgi:catechol 2,3-dioxygenase-like lactoylglutathione lyase family enzyme